MADNRLDLLLINPGGREAVYQNLGTELSAIEPPLWCRLIAGYARDRGYAVEILDSEALEMGPDSVAAHVAKRNPVLSCMVVFGHQPSASTQMMVGAGMTCQAIRDGAPDIPQIILGGHVSALPERTLNEEAVDYACKGEGPVTVCALIDALKSGDPINHQDIPGLVWKNDDDEVVVNTGAPLFKDLDKDLHGNAWDLLPMEKYRAHNWQCFGDLDSRKPYASIYTSLGCPYKCNFCCINAPFDVNRYRMRRPDQVVKEIQYLHRNFGVTTIKIIDEMFVLNDAHVTAICQGLIDAGLGPKLNIWAYARVDTVKPERLALLRAAGIKWLALGIESGSKHVRDGAEKKLKSDDIVQIVRQIQQADIAVIGNFIFGLPDDDMETMGETLKLAQDLNCEFANLYSAMAYPGSPLFGDALLHDWPLPDAWSGYSQHSYDCQPLPTEKLSAAQVLKFRDDAFHAYFENPRYLDMVTQRFGWDTRHHIEEMTKTRLKRKLLDQESAA